MPPSLEWSRPANSRRSGERCIRRGVSTSPLRRRTPTDTGVSIGLPLSRQHACGRDLRRPAVSSAAQTVGQPAGEFGQTLYETHNDYRDILSSSQPALSFSLAMTSSTSQPKPIVIIGAGIIGLSTAVRVLQSRTVQKQGIPVHVIADHLPADPLDPMYASTIAGAHHLSFADDGDARQRRWDSASASRAVMTADSQPCAS